jgi:TPR repeat protein
LAAVALLFAFLADMQATMAEKQRHEADGILARATHIIGQLQHQMDIETKHEAFALFQAGAKHGDATSMRNVGVSYKNGLGATQDYRRVSGWRRPLLRATQEPR